MKPDWRAEAQENLDILNLLCSAHETPPYYRQDNLNLGEFIEARQNVALLNNAADVFKRFSELLDYAEGTQNRRGEFEFIERAREVYYRAIGNT